ncbi:MAG: hypothetical protein ACQESK_01550 [Bacteroidota bacterium]
MKNYKKAMMAFLLIIIAGCSDEIDNLNNEEVSDEISTDKELGKIPSDHQVYKVFDYNQLLDLYNYALTEESNNHYFTNFKHICLFKIFEIDSFIEKSSPEERLFLINELVKMENALPNIDHFYEIIVYILKNEEVEIDKAENLIKTFEDKNKAALQNLNLKSELKDKKLKSLKDGRTQVNLFYRTKSMNDLKNSSK